MFHGEIFSIFPPKKRVSDVRALTQHLPPQEEDSLFEGSTQGPLPQKVSEASDTIPSPKFLTIWQTRYDPNKASSK
jgi:hypothetical protein